MTIDLDFRPGNAAELKECLADPMWRLCSGALYTVELKSEIEGEGMVAPFRPNRTQLRLIKSLWTRNLCLKARQLGCTTLVAIMWLDHALFNANQVCGIIAQDLNSAGTIFRKKVKAVYERLPPELRGAMPLKRESSAELVFAHNDSSIHVATSMRSGTIHRLHISEFGVICAKYPDKAEEIVTGSLPAVPSTGIVFIESTAKGREGAFFKMSERARGLREGKAKLAASDYRFHFFPWYADPEYRLDSDHVVISQQDEEYFAKVEAEQRVTLDMAQKRWYVSKRDSDFSGDTETMWSEFPSTPLEAFAVSVEGAYYSVQLSAARKQGRVGTVPYDPRYPVNSFWDIGASDGTAVLLHQKIGLQHRFFKFIEGWNEPYEHFTLQMQAMGCMWGVHYVPHDAGHKRQQGKRIRAPVDELRELSLGGRWVVVPPVDAVMNGIKQTRAVFGLCWFDEAGCKEFLAHLGAYRKTWNAHGAYWNDNVPDKAGGHSEAADAFRQFGQIERKIGLTRRQQSDATAEAEQNAETPGVSGLARGKGSWMSG